MEFGRLPVSQLNNIDFTLPKEPLINKHILPGKKSAKAKVYVGCAKWGRKEWVGKIYPTGTPEKDFLRLYVDHFNSIELNATGYKTPSLQQVKTWGEKALTREFLFCPKLVRFIIPTINVDGQKESINQFLESVRGFRKKPGPGFSTVAGKFFSRESKTILPVLERLSKNQPVFYRSSPS